MFKHESASVLLKVRGSHVKMVMSEINQDTDVITADHQWEVICDLLNCTVSVSDDVQGCPPTASL